MIRVAIVEDETITRRAIGLALRDQGFDVHEAADAHACAALLKTQPIDVVLLDLGLPGLEGLEFARQLQNREAMGLIVVTRQAAPEARIQALDVGADDYVVKPVHYGELAARIRSVSRRCRPQSRRLKKLGAWEIDLDARTVTCGAATAPLTRGEFDILARLIEAQGKIVRREDLLAGANPRPRESDLRSVDALVSRIRRKLAQRADGGNLIVTAPGFGYRLVAAAQDA